MFEHKAEVVGAADRLTISKTELRPRISRAGFDRIDAESLAAFPACVVSASDLTLKTTILQ
jgi:hypothetical protein